MGLLATLGGLVGLNGGYSKGNATQTGTATGTQHQIGSQSSQYVIPGAASNFGTINSAIGQGYDALNSGLANSEMGLRGEIGTGQEQQLQQAMGLTNNFGQTAQTNLAQNYQQQMGAQNQNLINRGLGNTTVQNSIQSGLGQRYAQDALINLPEQVNQLRLATLGQFGQPIWQTQAQLGQQGNMAVANSMQNQLQAEQGLGQQYLGLIGQQGVKTANTGQALDYQSNNWGQTNKDQFNVGANAGANASNTNRDLFGSSNV